MWLVYHIILQTVQIEISSSGPGQDLIHWNNQKIQTYDRVLLLNGHPLFSTTNHANRFNIQSICSPNQTIPIHTTWVWVPKGNLGICHQRLEETTTKTKSFIAEVGRCLVFNFEVGVSLFVDFNCRGNFLQAILFFIRTCCLAFSGVAMKFSGVTFKDYTGVAAGSHPFLTLASCIRIIYSHYTAIRVLNWRFVRELLVQQGKLIIKD